MARNVWEYALLGGIQGGAQGLAQGMAEEERANREERLMNLREQARLRYLDDQQEGYKDRDAARFAARVGAAGSSGSTGSRSGGVVDVEQLKKQEVYVRTDDDEAIAQSIRDSGQSVLKILGEDGQGRYFKDSELWQSKRAELAELRKGLVHGKDLKDVNEGLLIGRAGNGDMDAQAGLLATKGKGRKDGLAGGVGVFDTLDGTQSLNAVGNSASSENYAQAGKYAADAKKIKAEVDDALKAGATEKLHHLLNSVNRVLEDPMTPKETKEQYTAIRNRLGQAINSAMDKRDGVSPTAAPSPAPGPKPSASPKPAAKPAPYKDGTRLRGKDGKMYVVENGIPVLEK